jgi:hypothetical protein
MIVACRTPGPPAPDHLLIDNDVGHFFVDLAGHDGDLAPELSTALAHAGPALAQWGHLDQTVEISLEPDHAALEHAIGHKNDPGIRAFTTYDRLFLQAPGTWPPSGASQKQLDETITHELTHALMFQLAADSTSWRRKPIPFWFREGMATFTADQGYRFPTLEALAQTLATSPVPDPVRDGADLSFAKFALAYGAAHHAFTFLIDRYGKDALRSLLARMKHGQTFTDAFVAEYGLSVDAFVKDFETYVRLRGFLPGRLDARPGKGKVDGSEPPPPPQATP